MSTEYFRRRERCEHEGCPERSFYVGDDGFIYCRRGHQQSSQGTVIAEDTGELVQAGKKHKRAGSEAPSISSAGSSAGQSPIEVLLLCLQLILRKQVRWLIEQGLPADSEQVVKDLWTIQIRQLDPSTNVGHDSEDERSQLFSSQTESEFETDSRSRSTSRKRRPEPQLLGQMDLLAILYIAALIIRAPITVGDVYAWISSGDLPYYQSSRQVPEGLRRQLPGHLQRLLDPETWMKPHRLHLAIHKKLAFYESHGLRIPGINVNVIVLRWVKTLTLPLEIYQGATRIIDLIDLHISWNAAGPAWTSKVPEVLLMGAIIVAAKLLFPLDGQLSETDSPRDLAVLGMDWSAWSAIMPRRLHDEAYEKSFKAKQNDFLHIDDDETDQYLSWYTQNMTSKHASEHGRAQQRADLNRDLMALFPVHDAVNTERPDIAQSVTERLRKIQSKLSFGDRAVTSYQQYLILTDIEEEGQEPMKHLYELAAELCAIDLSRLIRIVCLIEKHQRQLESEPGHRNE